MNHLTQAEGFTGFANAPRTLYTKLSTEIVDKLKADCGLKVL